MEVGFDLNGVAITLDTVTLSAHRTFSFLSLPPITKLYFSAAFSRSMAMFSQHPTSMVLFLFNIRVLRATIVRICKAHCRWLKKKMNKSYFLWWRLNLRFVWWIFWKIWILNYLQGMGGLEFKNILLIFEFFNGKF